MTFRRVPAILPAASAALASALFAPWASAQGAAQGAGQDAAQPLLPSLLQTTLALVFILAIIWAAAWLLRRASPLAMRQGSLLRLIASLPVGQRERVVIVEVGDEWLVLGVSAGNVTKLSTLPKQAQADAPAVAQSFQRLLARARGERPAS